MLQRSAGLASTSAPGWGRPSPSLRAPARALHPRPRALGVRATAADVAPAEELSEEKVNIQKLLSKPYKYGFKTIIESDVFPKGLSEDVVRAISAKKAEPEWMLEFRCAAAAGGARSLARVRAAASAAPTRTRPPP